MVDCEDSLLRLLDDKRRVLTSASPKSLASAAPPRPQLSYRSAFPPLKTKKPAAWSGSRTQGVHQRSYCSRAAAAATDAGPLHEPDTAPVPRP